MLVSPLALAHRVFILQNFKSGTSHHITHHTSHIAYDIAGFQNISDQDSVALQQSNKTDPEEGDQIRGLQRLLEILVCKHLQALSVKNPPRRLFSILSPVVETHW